MLAMTFGSLAAAVSLAALFSVSRLRGVETTPGVFAAFAAGALVTITIAHMAPTALAANDDAPMWMLLGVAAGVLLHRGFAASRGVGEVEPSRTAIAATAAIAVHSFLDGLATAIVLAADPLAGALAAFGLILHKAPEAIVVFTLLRSADWPAARAIALAFLAAGVTTPLGAALGASGLAYVEPHTVATFMAIAAGLLLFIALAQLLPLAHRPPSRHALPALALGGLLTLAALELPALAPGWHGDHLHWPGDARPVFRAPPPWPPARG